MKRSNVGIRKKALPCYEAARRLQTNKQIRLEAQRSQVHFARAFMYRLCTGV